MLDNALVLNVAVVRHLCRVHVQEPDAQAFQRESRSDLSFLTEDELLPAIDAARSAELKEVRREPGLLEHQVKARLSAPHSFFETRDFGFIFFRQLRN